MSNALFKLAAQLLRQASEEFSHHGGNDLYLDDTPENRELAAHITELEEEELQIVDGKILILDWEAMDYCADELDEIEIPEEYIPDGA